MRALSGLLTPLVLVLISLRGSARAWHASLGQRATPVQHATTQRGQLEMPRAQDVLYDPCLVLTTSAQKLHQVCNTTCASSMRCDWSCKAAWNSFLRDAHSVEGMECPAFGRFLDQSPFGDSMVPLFHDEIAGYPLIAMNYLILLVDACETACREPDAVSEAENFYPCGRVIGSGVQNSTTFRMCNDTRNMDVPACFPLSPLGGQCSHQHWPSSPHSRETGANHFSVTDGKHWYPFVTWGAVAHYKQKHMGNTGGFYHGDAYHGHGYLENNEYSSWFCLWEESCETMRAQRKMACFRYSHIRGEFHWWKWSDGALDGILDVWIVYGSFCDHERRPSYVHARDRSKTIEPSKVTYDFQRLHRDGKLRSALTGSMSDLGPGGCGALRLQRDMEYRLKVTSTDVVGEYYTSVAYWTSPTKAQLVNLAKSGVVDIPIVIPLLPKQGMECSSLVFTLTWCESAPTDIDLVLFRPDSSSSRKVFDPDTTHAIMNQKRVNGQHKMSGPNGAFLIELEMDDDGSHFGGFRSYGPETMYMSGDLEEGTYALMTYVVASAAQDTFCGCETISIFSGMPGTTDQLDSVSVGRQNSEIGDWWHVLNVRVTGQGSGAKSFEYGIINKVYDGPRVCNTGCGIGGNDVGSSKLFRPTMSEMMAKEQWKMAGITVDPRDMTPSNESGGYKAIMSFNPLTRECEIATFIEIRALDAVTDTDLPDAVFRLNGGSTDYSTFDYRLSVDPAGLYSGGFSVGRGQHVFEVRRKGYISQSLTVVLPSTCKGAHCLPPGIAYREVYMVPNDGRTRIVLNWGNLPRNLDLLVMPVGVVAQSHGMISWKDRKGNDVAVYDQKDYTQTTTSYGLGREPYASHNLVRDGSCRCEYTCKENSESHPFVCSHYSSARKLCSAYEDQWKLVPHSEPGQAPLCVHNGITKAACCCNKPTSDGSISCHDGKSDSWCCPLIDEIPGSLCQPLCAMRTDSGSNATQISIDRTEADHNRQASDSYGKYVNRPEVATLSNLLVGMYKVFVNAYSPSEKIDSNTIGAGTSVVIYFGNGKSETFLIDNVSTTGAGGKWLYAGYIMVTETQQSCLGQFKMLQTVRYEDKGSCYSWFKAGYFVKDPLAVRYGAVNIRIARASYRDQGTQPDFSGVQYSVHAGGSCSCTVSTGYGGCRCVDSVMLHSGALGPTVVSNEEASGWAITVVPIYVPVVSDVTYTMILSQGNYYDQAVPMAMIDPLPLGQKPTTITAVMVRRTNVDGLRVVLTFSGIEDGDLYIFRDPLPGKYENEGSNNDPFVFWDDQEALSGIKLEQDCTTNECGTETVLFSSSPDHVDATYSVVVNVYAGVGQDSEDGKCVLHTTKRCRLQGNSTNPDETVHFYDNNGLITQVRYQSRFVHSDMCRICTLHCLNAFVSRQKIVQILTDSRSCAALYPRIGGWLLR